MKKVLNNMYRNYLKFGTQNTLIVAITVFAFTGLSSCKKLLEVEPSNSTLLTSSVFTDAATVQASINGMYTTFATQASPYRWSLSTLPGFSADELSFVGSTYDTFINNSILSTDGNVNNIWNTSYSAIYNANSIIEGIATSKNISQTLQNQAVGEARFMRAFCYFYLVNIFGDVPLVLTTDVDKNKLMPKTSSVEIYTQIVEDLKIAQANLPEDYSASGNSRTRANKWVATAMLARVYLYMQNWSQAEIQATSVIDNAALFNLATNLNTVFSPTSSEAIWQVYNDSDGYTYYARNVLPNANTQTPSHVLTTSLANAFEIGDGRKSAWTNTVVFNGTSYTYPYKYKSLALGSNTEYFTLLRLAEQYLIRAEARAQQDNLGGAKADVDIIRGRARTLPGTLVDIVITNKANMLVAIAQENRIEFNAEFGHRWLDLKRTNTVNAVIGALKPTVWKPTAALYPTPSSQVLANPNLSPTPGYIY